MVNMFARASGEDPTCKLKRSEEVDGAISTLLGMKSESPGFHRCGRFFGTMSLTGDPNGVIQLLEECKCHTSRSLPAENGRSRGRAAGAERETRAFRRTGGSSDRIRERS